MSDPHAILTSKVSKLERKLKVYREFITSGQPISDIGKAIIVLTRELRTSIRFASHYVDPNIFERLSEVCRDCKDLGENDHWTATSSLLRFIVHWKTWRQPGFRGPPATSPDERSEYQQVVYLAEWAYMQSVIKRICHDPTASLIQLKTVISHGVRYFRHCIKVTSRSDLRSMQDLYETVRKGVAAKDHGILDQFYYEVDERLRVLAETDGSQVSVEDLQPMTLLIRVLGFGRLQ